MEQPVPDAAPAKKKGDEEPIDHMAYMRERGISESDCANCNKNLVGTIKKYSKHLIICYGNPLTWISDIKEGGTAQKISNALDEYNQTAEKKAKFVITATDHDIPDTSSDDVSIIVYPDAVIYKLKVDSDFVSFIRSLASKTPFSSAPAPVPVPWSNLVLVCAHAARDNRCGRAGPQVIEEFRAVLAERGIPESTVTVRSSSHLGGHKFAGVLVVYPHADWYGMITKRNVPDLLDSIMSGTKYMKGWRGNESMDW
jgi:hypothetical protein